MVQNLGSPIIFDRRRQIYLSYFKAGKEKKMVDSTMSSSSNLREFLHFLISMEGTGQGCLLRVR